MSFTGKDRRPEPHNPQYKEETVEINRNTGGTGMNGEALGN